MDNLGLFNNNYHVGTDHHVMGVNTTKQRAKRIRNILGAGAGYESRLARLLPTNEIDVSRYKGMLRA
jgi:hypothetical protein